MTVARPIMWTYEYYNGERWMRLLTIMDPSVRGPHDPTPIRNVQMWGVGPVPVESPPAPAAPVTTPEVEAARRKALGAIFAALAEYPWACDTCIVAPTGMTRAITYGVLRDLVGQPRKYPDRAIRGYDNDGPPGPHPLFGGKGEKAVPPPARLSVPMLASIISNRLEGVPAWSTQTVANVAKAVHEAVYGEAPTRGEQKGDE